MPIGDVEEWAETTRMSQRLMCGTGIMWTPGLLVGDADVDDVCGYCCCRFSWRCGFLECACLVGVCKNEETLITPFSQAFTIGEAYPECAQHSCQGLLTWLPKVSPTSGDYQYTSD